MERFEALSDGMDAAGQAGAGCGDILGAWDDFVHGRNVDESCIKSHVLRSWRLSREHRVDPFSCIRPQILSPKELKALRAEHKELLAAADPVLRMVEVSIRNTGFIATLTVMPGYLLEVVGDDKVLPLAERGFNVAGAIRTVEAVGTSALVLSILEGTALQVTGPEHYNRTFHHWACSSAPICDNEDRPFASLTISGHVARQQEHTFALVKAAAEAIGTRLREGRLLKEQQLLSSMLAAVYESLPDAVISAGTDGVVSQANARARRLLGAGAALVGRNMGELVAAQSRGEIREILSRGQPGTADIALPGPAGTERHMCRFVPVRGPGNGGALGMTFIVPPRSTMLDIARRVGGNYARFEFGDIKGTSPGLRVQIDLARRAAGTGARILLTGESGTGKELFAQAVHNASSVRGGPFVAVSCAAIPRELLESELFGYVGGAFTGAREKGMVGKFELAANGTLFLDEINSLPLELQAKLLRVLQQREVVRIGDSRPVPVSARVIAATNVDLVGAVAAGAFREDLYYRLNVVEITIPPLRERKEDIPLLARHILGRLSAEAHLPLPDIAPEAMAALTAYGWPGNVRELDNVCERALLMSGGGQITPGHLSPHIAGEAAKSAPQAVGSLDEGVRRLILSAIGTHKGNLSRAARELGIARSTLYRNMRKLGIGSGHDDIP